MKIRPIAIGCAVFVLATSPFARAGTVIDGTVGWGGQSVYSWGEPGSATVGQTFTPGVDARLDNFTFYIADSLDPDTLDFTACVMAWTGTRATGAVLYQSAPMSSTHNHGAGGWEQVTINTGGLQLVSGVPYVAFFTSSGLFDGSQGLGAFGFNPTEPYSGGVFVYANSGNDFSQLSTTDWVTNFGGDAAFGMEFNVPSPGVLSLAMLLFIRRQTR